MSYTFSDLGRDGVIALSHKVLASMRSISHTLITRLYTTKSSEDAKYTAVVADSYKALHQILNNLYNEEFFDAFESKDHMKYVIDITDFSPHYLTGKISSAIKDLSTDYECYDDYMVMDCFESQIPQNLHQCLGLS